MIDEVRIPGIPGISEFEISQFSPWNFPFISKQLLSILELLIIRVIAFLALVIIPLSARATFALHTRGRGWATTTFPQTAPRLVTRAPA